MPGWMNHKLESILPGEIPTSDMQITLLAASEEQLKSLLMRVKTFKKKKKRPWQPVPSLHGK